MKTLEEIEQLKQSRFGRPRPRHGLKLLYWFAKNCLSLNHNNVMQSRYYPEKGDFGFHTFENRYERNGKLLPDVHFPYYEVGNLSKTGAYNLPTYVREDYTHSPDKSNMDRIIVSLNNKCFDRVYVTEHSDASNFNKDFTYHISTRLIMIIRGLSLEQFLLQTGYSKQETNSFPTSPVKLSDQQPPCPAPSTAYFCRPVQDICFICRPETTSSTNQDLCTEIESSSNSVKNNSQGDHKASPSICSPAITSSLTQDLQKEIESLVSLIKMNRQGHHEAPPTASVFIPSSTSSMNQDLHNGTGSSSILTNNNAQIHTTSILQPQSKDIPITSPSTPTIIATKNQNTDIDSSLVSQMNFFFWGAYFMFVYLFFTFLWGNVMRILITVSFLLSVFPWQNWNRLEREQEKERDGKKSKTQKGKRTGTKITTKGGRKKYAMHDVATCTPPVMSSRNQNTDTESPPVSFFWGYYFLFLFFYFFWRDIMQIFINVIF